MTDGSLLLFCCFYIFFWLGDRHVPCQSIIKVQKACPNFLDHGHVTFYDGQVTCQSATFRAWKSGLYMQLGKVSSCSCLTLLPCPVWVLLCYVLQPKNRQMSLGKFFTQMTCLSIVNQSSMEDWCTHACAWCVLHVSVPTVCDIGRIWAERSAYGTGWRGEESWLDFDPHEFGG